MEDIEEAQNEELLDPKIAFLCEMFEDLEVETILEIYKGNENLSIEALVEKCLVLNEARELQRSQETKPESTDIAKEIDSQNEPQSAITLVPILAREDSEELNAPEPPEKADEMFDPLFEILTEHIDEMRVNQSLKTIISCVNTCKKCLGNILKNPNNDKFRMIKKDHPMVQQKILIPGGLEFFEIVGWSDSDGLLLYSNNDVAQIFNLSNSLEMLLDSLKDDLQKQKAALLQNTGQNYAREKRKAQPQVNYVPAKKKKKKLTMAEIRARRVEALANGSTKVNANYQGKGPKAGRRYVPGQKNFKQDLKNLREQKQRKWTNHRGKRKRVFTMRDIEEMAKDDKDYKTRGLERNDFLNNIGKEALRLTNEFRQQHGLQPLLWSQPIADVGLVHSRDMGTGRVPFSHQGFKERVQQFPHKSFSSAENVAMSQGISNVAKCAVDGWIDSPGHRKNLLSHHQWCGIGVYRNSAGAYYLTQLFAAF